MSLLLYFSDLRARLKVVVDKIMTLAKYQDAEKDKIPVCICYLAFLSYVTFIVFIVI